jgi:hypothetical protein
MIHDSDYNGSGVQKRDNDFAAATWLRVTMEKGGRKGTKGQGVSIRRTGTTAARRLLLGGVLVKDSERLVDLAIERWCIFQQADELVVVHLEQHPSNFAREVRILSKLGHQYLKPLS